MRTKSALSRSVASSHPRAAARLIPFGLINPFMMAVKGFAHRMIPSVARSAGMKWFLIFMMAGLWCLPLHGAPQTNTYEFAKSLPKPGSVQWEINNRLNKERQEIYRKRVAIPDAVGPDVPRAASANLVNGQNTLAAPAHPPMVSAGRFLKLFFFTVALAFAGVLLVRKFTPQVLVDLNQRFNPWAVVPATERNFPAKVRAEEESFGEFLTTFRTGPSASPPTDASESEGPVADFYARAKKRLVRQRKLLAEIDLKS